MAVLPIHEVADQIVAALGAPGGNRLVLTAPPGSGKTTQVPQILYRAAVGQSGEPGQAGERRIIVLQPRRLATRMVAQRVALEMKTPVGELVGYQTRHDSRVSRHTRITFMTEGLFLRWMLGNPTLPGVAMVLLDEFHERSLAADTILGLIRKRQDENIFRRHVGLVVMSATLDAKAVAQYLRCPVVQAGGRMYPVAVSYLPSRSKAPVWELAADKARAILDATDDGHTLIFMPGAYEINRTLDACRGIAAKGDILLFPLHGSLSPAQQDAAVAPAAPGQRKIIVATNIAETSITIDGVRHVIDSGTAKVHRYDPRRGINVLLSEPISKASAEQRAGRAGRTAPGSCTRLWPQNEHAGRDDHDDPEILRLDLAEVVLQLKAMGIDDVRGFPWLTPPAELALDHGEALLRTLHAIDEKAGITDIGKRMAEFPLHPRLSRMLLEAMRRGCVERACLWAALISERSILLGDPPRDLAEPKEGEPRSDLIVMERLFGAAAAGDFQVRACDRLNLSAQTCREVQRACEQLTEICQDIERELNEAMAPADRASPRRSPPPGRSQGTASTPQAQSQSQTTDLLRCLLTAFPDHVAFRPDAQRADCRMTGRKRVVIDKGSVVKRPGLLLALEVRETGAGDAVKTSLSIVSEIEPAWLQETHPDRIAIRDEVEWNADAQAVEQVESHAFDGQVFFRKARQQVDPREAADVLVEQLVQGNVKLEQWDEKVEQWIVRTRLVARWFPQRGLIAYEPDDLRVILHEIVATGDAVRFSQVKDRPCLQAVMNALSWEDQRFVQQMAPETIKLPGGWGMKVEYTPDGPPRGRAKIQDFYGLSETPRVAAGKAPVVLEILGPNYRPVQVTDNLASFWANTYPELKKELKRRYPKHEWR